jgi:LysM repeat protein
VDRAFGEADADDREAFMARLAGMGMGGNAATPDRASPDAGTPRPVSGVTRDVDQRPYTRYAPDPDHPLDADEPSHAAAPGRRAGGSASAPEAEQRAATGLARILGWDRRPRAGSGRQQKPERDPAWERPRRYEAYPSLKTRVGVGSPSRLVIYAIGLFVAAAILFFVPPMLLRQGGGTAGPGATESPDPSASVRGSARPSVVPSVVATPKQTTYTVKAGDTLSSIAKRFKITVDQLLAANKQIKNPDKIAIGDVLVIPRPQPSEIVDAAPSSSQAPSSS